MNSLDIYVVHVYSNIIIMRMVRLGKKYMDTKRIYKYCVVTSQLT